MSKSSPKDTGSYFHPAIKHHPRRTSRRLKFRRRRSSEQDPPNFWIIGNSEVIPVSGNKIRGERSRYRSVSKGEAGPFKLSFGLSGAVSFQVTNPRNPYDSSRGYFFRNRALSQFTYSHSSFPLA